MYSMTIRLILLLYVLANHSQIWWMPFSVPTSTLTIPNTTLLYVPYIFFYSLWQQKHTRCMNRTWFIPLPKELSCSSCCERKVSTHCYCKTQIWKYHRVQREHKVGVCLRVIKCYGYKKVKVSRVHRSPFTLL